jgi:hypothetical protein
MTSIWSRLRRPRTERGPVAGDRVAVGERAVVQPPADRAPAADTEAQPSTAPIPSESVPRIGVDDPVASPSGPEESVDQLTDILSSGGRHEQRPEVEAIASFLDHQPLALEHAAVYLLEMPAVSCAEYLDLMQRDAQYRPRGINHSGEFPDAEAKAVDSTANWLLGEANLREPRFLAPTMFYVLCQLDPAGVPAPVLVSRPVLGWLTTLRDFDRRYATGPFPPGPVTSEEAVATLRTLHRLRLIEYTPEDPLRAVRLHSAIRAFGSPGQRPGVTPVVADAIVAAWPDSDPALERVLRANALSLIAIAEDHLYVGDHPDPNRRSRPHEMLFRLGLSLGESGQPDDARKHFQHVVDEAVRRIGPDSQGTLLARASLAYWIGATGDPAGAVAAYSALQSDWTRVLGPDHRDLLTIRAYLARFKGEAGDPAAAVAELAELVPETERKFGPAHSATRSTRALLAHWRQQPASISAPAPAGDVLPDTGAARFAEDRVTAVARGESGDPAGAVAALAELLPAAIRALGPTHHETLVLRGDLARWRGEAGDLAGAAAAFAELLPEAERELGRSDEQTFAIRVNLARWRGEAGDPGEAAQEMARVVDDMEHALGPNHPDTLLARYHLARWRGEAGDAAGAAAEFAELLPAMTRVRGADHQETLATRNILARWRGEAGDPARAAAEAASVLADQLRVLGSDNPDTLITRNNLARWRGESGDAAGAAAAYAELADDCLRVLGPDHTETLVARNNHARWQSDAGDPAGAEAAFAELLTDRLRILGPDHPHTLDTRANLAMLRLDAGDLRGTLAALTGLLPDMLRVLGPDHPDTIAVRDIIMALSRS